MKKQEGLGSRICMWAGAVLLAQSLFGAIPNAEDDSTSEQRLISEPSALVSVASYLPNVPANRPISIVAEIGTEIPPIYLLDLDLPENQRVLFELSGGSARFAGPFRRTVTEGGLEDGRLVLPKIFPGDRLFEETLLTISSQGERLVRDLRIAVVQEGWVASYPAIPSIGDTALLLHAATFAVVDEGLIDYGRWQEDYVNHRLESPSSHDHSPQALEPIFDNFDPSATNPDWCPGGCIRIPFPPGRVTWDTGQPWLLGWSVLRENFGGATPYDSLIPGQAPSQSIDALYNRLWGCGVALKVPDTCTATAGSVFAGVECCCNHSFALLGHVCRFVGPGGGPELDWPLCPL